MSSPREPREPSERRASVFADLPDPEAITPNAEFLELCDAQEIAFDAGDIERLGRYLALLLAANERVNLTAIRDTDAAWIRHIFDSLTLIAMLSDLDAGARIIDVGAGGGLPSLPLAITLPNLDFTLLEATGKKAEFLALAIGRLKLPNARVIQMRAEQAGQMRATHGATDGSSTSAGVQSRNTGGQAASGTGNEFNRVASHRESYDAAIARALGPIRVASELTVPLIKQHALVLLVKGERAEEELSDAAHALRELRATHAGTFDTPTGKIVCLTKHSATPRIYPRRDGEPKRHPL